MKYWEIIRWQGSVLLAGRGLLQRRYPKENLGCSNCSLIW